MRTSTTEKADRKHWYHSVFGDIPLWITCIACAHSSQNRRQMNLIFKAGTNSFLRRITGSMEKLYAIVAKDSESIKKKTYDSWKVQNCPREINHLLSAAAAASFNPCLPAPSSAGIAWQAWSLEWVSGRCPRGSPYPCCPLVVGAVAAFCMPWEAECAESEGSRSLALTSATSREAALDQLILSGNSSFQWRCKTISCNLPSLHYLWSFAQEMLTKLSDLWGCGCTLPKR